MVNHAVWLELESTVWNSWKTSVDEPWSQMKMFLVTSWKKIYVIKFENRWLVWSTKKSWIWRDSNSDNIKWFDLCFTFGSSVLLWVQTRKTRGWCSDLEGVLRCVRFTKENTPLSQNRNLQPTVREEIFFRWTWMMSFYWFHNPGVWLIFRKPPTKGGDFQPNVVGCSPSSSEANQSLSPRTMSKD